MPRPPSRRPALAAGLATLLLAAACATQGPERSDTLFSRIHAGMTEAEVERLAGPPDDKMPFALSHTVGWGYLYYDTWGFPAEFSVTFGPDGKAVSTLSKRVGYGGDHGT